MVLVAVMFTLAPTVSFADEIPAFTSATAQWDPERILLRAPSVWDAPTMPPLTQPLAGVGPEPLEYPSAVLELFRAPPNDAIDLYPDSGLAKEVLVAQPQVLPLPEEVVPPGTSTEMIPADELPPLDWELWQHGGSYLYHPEGDRLNWPDKEHAHYQVLRLPEWYQKPRPLTAFQQFLGNDPIEFYPRLHWFGGDGFGWEPRFVGYGGYQIFGIALNEGDAEQYGVGHQLLADLDFRITGTERAHVQFRPLGRGNTGGSFYQFNDPAGYDDNSTLIPQRWWIEGELYSIFSHWMTPFAPRDVHFVAGKFPFALHNQLLINDEILGVVLNKNTVMTKHVSNINVQLFYAPDDVDAFVGQSADLLGTNISADFKNAFIELTHAYLVNNQDDTRNSNYLAASVTKFFGPLSLSGRALFKFGDSGGRGSGQLFVLESNYTRLFESPLAHTLDIEYGVFYCNAFRAAKGWNSIAGGNFNRIWASFELNPLVRISAARDPDDNTGAACGVQLFRHHEDESWIPEVAIESPSGEPVWGASLRYLRKTGKRAFFEVQGVVNGSRDRRFRREGLFVSETILF